MLLPTTVLYFYLTDPVRLVQSSSSSSSIHSTTLGGSRSVQQFYSTPVYPRPSPSNQQFSSPLGLLLPGPSTLTCVSLLVLFYMASILLFFVFSILITWAAHLSLCDFINFISSCFILCLSSSLGWCSHIQLIVLGDSFVTLLQH